MLIAFAAFKGPKMYGDNFRPVKQEFAVNEIKETAKFSASLFY